MATENLYLQTIFLAVSILIYTFLIFELGDTFLQNSRLKRILRIPLGVLNFMFAMGVVLYADATSMTSYTCFLIILFLEYFVFYKDKLLRILALVFSYFLNIMAVRAICVSMFSMFTGIPMYVLLIDNRWLISSMTVTFMVLNTMLYMVKKLLSPEKARVITEHTDQLIFLISSTGVSCLYLLFVNTNVYSIQLPYDFIVDNQLWVSVALLVGYYIVLIFSIKVGESAHIKIKNIELSQSIETEYQFRDAVVKDALNVYEINLSKDILVKGFENIPGMIFKNTNQYSQLLQELVRKMVYHEDVELFVEYALPEKILAEYYKGRREIEIGYRRRNQDGNYIWVKAVANLYTDHATGDIKAFVYIKDVHDEKMHELELKHRAERDSLTNLYNKGATESLISDFLSIQSGNQHKGALLIVDVDNFKMVNDLLGHTFGDSVLCDFAEKLTTIFRNTNSSDGVIDYHEDIIGRVGGDEFIIFIKNAVDVQLLIHKAESICKAFSKTYYSNNNVKIEISSSIGIAIFPYDGTSFAQLYKSADVALYLSKNKGKNGYSFYNGEDFVGYESNRGVVESVNTFF